MGTPVTFFATRGTEGKVQKSRVYWWVSFAGPVDIACMSLACLTEMFTMAYPRLSECLGTPVFHVTGC